MTDVINTIALHRNSDTRHRLHYLEDGALCSITLAELDARAISVALRLRELGIRPGGRVGIIAPNSLEWVLLDLAVLKLGAVTAGFAPGRFDPDELVDSFGLAVLFTPGAGAEGPVRDLAVIADWARGTDPAAREHVPLHRGYDPADICAIKFTSGSTGMPKGLEATVASLNSSLNAVQEMFAHGDGDNLLTFLGNWLVQQRYWIYSALVFGHDVTIVPLVRAAEAARRAAPTVIMGVPGFYEEVRSRLVASGVPVDRDVIQRELGGRIRYLWTGSAPASSTMLEFFNHNGVPLYEGYGLSETCIVSKNHPGAFRLGSVGKVLPDKTVRFDADGVLIVGGKHPINTRYTWSAPGANEKMFLPTGEVKTYDLGYVDEDGFLFVQGRVDDVISVSSGYGVLSPLLEHKLREHPGVHQCVLYGNGRPFLSAVVSPAALGPDREDLGRFVTALNDTLLPEQRIHALVLAAEPFSFDNGLLTDQFKPKRTTIHTRYAAELEAIYAGRPDAANTLLVIEQIKERA